MEKNLLRITGRFARKNFYNWLDIQIDNNIEQIRC